MAGCGGGDDADTASPAHTTAAPEVETTLPVAVDRRVEALTLLFRLAGTRPYGPSATPYARAADAHFAAVRSHPAVAATAALTREHGISFDAPIQLAAYLDESLEPTRPLSPLPPGLDERWKGVGINAYLALVRAFADTSRLDGFLASQSGYHRKVERAFQRFLAGHSVVDWLDGVFGARAGASVRVVPWPAHQLLRLQRHRAAA